MTTAGLRSGDKVNQKRKEADSFYTFFLEFRGVFTVYCLKFSYSTLHYDRRTTYIPAYLTHRFVSFPPMNPIVLSMKYKHVLMKS